MRKILLLLFAICSAIVVQGQLTYKDIITGGSISGNGRSPQSSYQSNKVVFIVTATEMQAMGAGTTIKAIGFKYQTEKFGTAADPANIKIYMQNTNDAAYNKGSSFTAALTGMTKVSDGLITAGGVETLDIPFENGDPFVYTGGAVYVAYEYTNTGAKGTANTALCNNAAVGGVEGLWGSGSASGTANNTIAKSLFRPYTRFAYQKTANDAGVLGLYAMSQAPVNEGLQKITARISNNGLSEVQNVNVTLTVSGANTFTSTKNIDILSQDDIAIVNFDDFVAVNEGTNTISVAIDYNDDIAGNNTKQITQEVVKGRFSHNLGTGFSGSSYGYTSGKGIMGVKYRANGTVTMKGLRFYVSNNSTGNGSRPIKAVLLDKDGNTLATSDTYEIETVDQGTWLILNFTDQTQTITDDDFYVAVAMVGDQAYYPYAVETEDPIRPNTYFGAGTFNEGGVTDMSVITRKVTMEALTSNSTPGTIDVSTSTVYALAKSPLTYGADEVITAVVKNDGDMIATDYPVTLTVSGANTYTNTQIVPKIPAGSSAVVSFAPFTATQLGTNTLTVTPDNITAKAKTISQEITTGLYSYTDESPRTQNYGNLGSASVFLAKYKMTGTRKIKAVRVLIGTNASNPGKKVYAVLTNADGTAILGRSDDYIISNSDLGVETDFVLQTPISLTNQEFMVGLAMIVDGGAGFYPIGSQTENPTRTGTFYSGSNVEPYVLTEFAGGYRYMISALTEDATVPVTFNTFTANLNNAKTKLVWSVGTETNVNRYEIERKVNDGVFEKLTSVEAAGSSLYSVIDNQPAQGINYYRLKSVDNDGTMAYYPEIKAVRVATLANQSLTVYPNPATGKSVNVSLEGYAAGTYQYQLIDLNGRVVKQNSFINDTQGSQINIEGLAKGVYLLKVSNDKDTVQTKLIVK